MLDIHTQTPSILIYNISLLFTTFRNIIVTVVIIVIVLLLLFCGLSTVGFDGDRNDDNNDQNKHLTNNKKNQHAQNLWDKSRKFEAARKRELWIYLYVFIWVCVCVSMRLHDKRINRIKPSVNYYNILLNCNLRLIYS